MKKAFKIIGIVLLIAVIIGTFVFLYLKSRPKETSYQIEQCTVDTIVKKTVVTGKVEPRNEVLIKPQMSGIVSELCKKAGDRVQAGDIIAKLKVVPEMNALSGAESRLKLAKIAFENIQERYDRQKQLYKKGVISKEEFETSDLEYKRTKEEMENAQDALEIVQTGISKKMAGYSTTQIRATIAGMILDIPVKVGNSVVLSNTFNDGTTIASIANMSDMIFKGNIDETEVGRIKPGMDINVSLGAVQGTKLKAVLEYISPKGVESNGASLFEIKAALSIPDTLFVRSGYSANGEIILVNKKGILTVPESCIEFEGEKTFLHFLTSKENVKPQTFERREVKTGLSDGIKIEVIKGIKKGEKIRGNQNMNP